MSAGIRVLYLCEPETDAIGIGPPTRPFEIELAHESEHVDHELASYDYVLADGSISGGTIADLREEKADLPIMMVPDGRIDAFLDAIETREDLERDPGDELRIRTIEEAPVGITVTGPIDEDTPIRYVNAAFENLTGYGAEEIHGRNPRFLQGPDTDSDRVATLRTAVDQKRSASVVVRNYRSDDTPFWNQITIAPIAPDAGSRTYFAGFHRDVTDRVESVKRLEHQNRHLEALVEETETLLHATDFEEAARVAVETFATGVDYDLAGIWLSEQDGDRLIPTASSPGSTELIGEMPSFGPDTESIAWRAFRDKETIVAKDLGDEPERHNPDTSIGSEIVVPLGEFGVFIVASEEPNAFLPGEITVVELWAATTTMVLIRVQREQLLCEREADARRERDRLDEFASLMSHDLRNPLTVANGYLELAQDESDSEYLPRVEHALDRMETLISDMLTLAREGWHVGEPVPVPLDDAARDAWELTGSVTGTLQAETSAVVRADVSRLSQIFENLFKNASAHGDEDVTVQVGRLPDGFFVSDNGPGVPPENREDVFETGYSTNEDGTGFGLAIVDAIAEAHGWDIDLTESDEGGARFEFHRVEFVE